MLNLLIIQKLNYKFIKDVRINETINITEGIKGMGKYHYLKINL